MVERFKRTHFRAFGEFLVSRSYTASESFSSVDAAWLHMDRPTNLAVINGVIAFEGSLEFRRLKVTIENRLLIYRRFRQRVVEPPYNFGPPKWEVDPHFNLDDHLQAVTLPAPGDHNALQELVSDLMSEPLNPSKPLWKLYYVKNYDHGSALICRLHHCIADGLALVQVLLSTTDLQPDAPWAKPYDAPNREISPLARLLKPAVKAAMTAGSAWRTGGEMLHEGLEVLIDPSRLFEAAQSGASITRALGKLLFIPPDNRTILRGKLGVPKRAAWSSTIQLDQVKAIGQNMGGTVNDVLISTMTGALRRYLLQNGQAIKDLDIRAIVPVNLRPPDERNLMGNRFGLVYISLPVGIQDPLERLTVLKQRMDAIKDTPEAVVAFGMLASIGMTPKQIADVIVDIFGMKATVVITNVPGPQKPLYFCGQKIDHLMFWVPTPGNLGLGLSILSYAGKIVLGLTADEGLVPDPEAILENFVIEFEQLGRWGRPLQTQIESRSAELGSDEGYQRCQGMTKAGRQCKNRAKPGTSFCQVHQDHDSS